MSLFTEKGTGFGSKMGNVTIRAWIVLMLVTTVCVCSTLITAAQIWALVNDRPPFSLSVEPFLAGLAGVAVGYYFSKAVVTPEQPQRKDS